MTKMQMLKRPCAYPPHRNNIKSEDKLNPATPNFRFNLCFDKSCFILESTRVRRNNDAMKTYCWAHKLIA